MKKYDLFIWDNDSQQAFEKIKQYLMHPPVLVALASGKPFLLYVRIMDNSLRALLGRIMTRGMSKQSTTWVKPWSELNT